MPIAVRVGSEDIRKFSRRDEMSFPKLFNSYPPNILMISKKANVSMGAISFVLLAIGTIYHKTLTYMVFYPLCRLLFGTLYPAYASYKAVKSKNVKEYVKWMMYWIVFALFTCVETITDVFLSWFPFYYEIKIILVMWLLSPATKGSSFLYRKFVHPMLSSREQEIDEYISKAKEQSYKQVLDLGSKGVNVLMQTALKSGGGLVNQIKKSYSLSDLSDHHTREEGTDETDVMITDPRLLRKRQSPRRAPSTSMYFSEIDVRTDAIVSVQSAEDLSSGYSSGEALTQPLKLQAREGLVRTGSIGNRNRPTRVTRSTVIPKKSSTTDESELDLEEFESSSKNSSEKSDSSSDEEFLDTEEIKDVEEIQNTGNLITSTIERPKDSVTNIENLKTKSLSETKICEDTANPSELTSELSQSKDSLVEVEYKLEDLGCEVNVEVDKKDQRAGKYNKKAAPEPPKTPTITATLVLKPGILKPIGDEGQVFCHSPKVKRKSRSKSPSPSPRLARKIIATKDSTMNKLLMLPKRMGLIKDEKHDSQKKRSSWHEEASSLLSDNIKIQSKSQSNISQGSNNLPFVDEEVNKPEGNDVIIRQLSQSPSSRRKHQ